MTISVTTFNLQEILKFADRLWATMIQYDTQRDTNEDEAYRYRKLKTDILKSIIPYSVFYLYTFNYY